MPSLRALLRLWVKASRYGAVRYSAVRYSAVLHGTVAQHSTAQHSTAQHSTAQHSTVQFVIAGFRSSGANIKYWPSHASLAAMGAQGEGRVAVHESHLGDCER